MWKYGLFHAFMLYVAYGCFGWILGTLFLIAVFKVGDYFLHKNGYLRMNYGDLTMFYEMKKVNHNLAGYFILDKIDFESFRNHVYDRAVKNVHKLRSIADNLLGVLVWKDMGAENAKAQLKKCEAKLESEEQCQNYIEELLNKDMDFSKPLWEFILCEDYSKTESVVLVRMHHALTDGNGYVSLMSCINDEQYKLKLDKEFPKPNIFMDIFFTIVGPIYSLYLVAKFFLRSSDSNAKKVNDLKCEDTFRNKLYASDSRIPFDKIRNCYKRFEQKVSFNDYMMGVLSVSMDKWYKESGITGAEKLKSAITINTRPLPTKIEEVTLFNETIGM